MSTRLATVWVEGGTAAARVAGDQLALLAAPDVRAVLEAEAEGGSVGESGVVVSLDDADLAPLVPHPRKIVCLGLNYRDHIEEMGHPLPTFPTLFAKYDRALIGARDPIVLPPESDRVDWEVELAIIVGSRVRRARGDEALAAIAGFSVLNDVSARDWQNRTSEWLQGKTFESSTPLGPWLVPYDEVDGAQDLEVSCEVDGVMMQRSRTSELVFTPAEIIEYVSTVVTLDPGDVIATGTPGGVGVARDPAIFLRPGAVVRTRIEGIGELLNTCRADPAGRGRA